MRLNPPARAGGAPAQAIEFGRIAGSYGVRGWLKVVVEEPELLAAQPVWWLAGTGYRVEATRVHSGNLLAKLAGIEAPEQVRALKGKAVSIPRPQAGEGRYYWSDLVGLEVVNEQGVGLGVVKSMSSNGAHDVMELSTLEAAGERIRWLPFVPAYVRSVDLQGGRIEVDWAAEW